MKVVQMQYSPDAFDGFMREKLDEIKPDPALAEAYWNKISTEITTPGSSNRRKLLYFSIALLLLSVFLFMLLQKSNDDSKDTRQGQSSSPANNNPQVIEAPKIKPSATVIDIGTEHLPGHPQKTYPNPDQSEQPKTRMNNPQRATPPKTHDADRAPVEKLPELKTAHIQTDSIATSNLLTTPLKDSIQTRQPDVPRKDQKRNRVHIIW